MGLFIKGKTCEVFQAPFDIELSNENIQENKVVISDLSVICDKSGLGDNGVIYSRVIDRFKVDLEYLFS